MAGQRAFRVGVIGDPVEHSISPAMQQPALDELGVDASYERWHTLASDLPARIASLRAADALGANVTVPHKETVLPSLDDVDALARRAGAVNTIVNRGGRLFGANTDIAGFAAALAEACPDTASRVALVLGSGGAARAVVLGLESMGVTRILLWNRGRPRAERLAADLFPAPVMVLEADQASLAQALRSAGIIVNATSVGWIPGESPVPEALLDQVVGGTFVVDLTYRQTDLLTAAQARGLPTLDGLPMLVRQGAEALRLWTGRSAPVETMMRAAEAARKARA